MNIENLIKTRVSQKSYTDEKVSIDLVKELLNIAVFAPNHKMRQPWGFVLLEEDGKARLKERYLDRLSEDEKPSISMKLDKMYKAPLLLAVTMKTDPDFDVEIEDLQANASMIQNFTLLCVDKGLSTHWKTPGFIKTDKFKDVLGIEENELVTGMIMVGYADTPNRPKSRIDVNEKLTIYK